MCLDIHIRERATGGRARAVTRASIEGEGADDSLDTVGSIR